MSRHLHAVTAPVAADLEAQDASLDHECPACQAPRDDYCVNPLTGQYLHGHVSHWQRVKAATTPKDPT